MKIIVAIKQVPERDAAISIAADGRWIADNDLAYTINEPDAYALEEALRLKETLADSGASEVIALCAGPERVTSTLREALAKGADRAIHLAFDDPGSLDTLGVARMLADAVKTEAPDLILTGLQSDDLGLGQTGVVLAELLGIVHATIIMQVEKTATGLRVKRELEDGWFQHVEMRLPALLTIQSGGNKLRYATLMGIKKAKAKETKTVEGKQSGPAAVTLDRVYLPEKVKKTEMLTGSASEIAGTVVERLKFAVRVL
jgi:electron transfer flavoprotein beta subunit